MRPSKNGAKKSVDTLEKKNLHDGSRCQRTFGSTQKTKKRDFSFALREA